jgi:polar amino acid transport system substrate-binding protein
MKRKYLFFVSIIVILTLTLSACQPAGGTGGSGRPVVRVATEAAYPPFEMVDETTKELIGFDIELMTAIGEKAGLDIRFENTPWDPLLAGIATCQFDAAISAITITAERAKQMNFSEPYINAGQVITVRANDSSINSPTDLQGKTIGVQLGTTGHIEADKISGATVKPYDTVDLAFIDLGNGQLDGVIADYPTTINYVLKFSDRIKTTGDVFTDESYGIAVCKTNGELLTKINAALAELKAEGFVAELEEKWLAEE